MNPQNASPDRDEAQALLEWLWVLEEHRQPNTTLVKKVYEAREPRVRAAAVRTLGHWAGQVDGWEPILMAAAQDDSPLVRAEAAKAAVQFQGPTAAEVVLEVASRPTDPELNAVIDYATGQMDIDALVKKAVHSGNPLSQAARTYALQHADVEDLLKMHPDEEVYHVILHRKEAKVDELETALSRLATMTRSNELDLLLELLKQSRPQDVINLSGFV